MRSFNRWPQIFFNFFAFFNSKKKKFEKFLKKNFFTRFYYILLGFTTAHTRFYQMPSSSPAQVRSLCCSLSGFCTGGYSKWSWSGVFSFLLQVSLFLQFKRINPALRRLVPWTPPQPAQRFKEYPQKISADHNHTQHAWS